MKRVKMFVWMLPLLMFGVFACSQSQTDARELVGKWNIVAVNGKTIQQQEMPYVEFDMDERQLHGNAGCNMFNSSFTLDEQNRAAIVIAPGIATMMACPDMEIEDAIMQSLPLVKAVKAGKNENEMQLIGETGEVLFILFRN